MQQEDFGYDRDRFPSLNTDNFDCMICSSVARNPQECSGCGSLFCHSCITQWLTKKKQECPNRCDQRVDKITAISSRALLKVYNDLDVQCINFEKCKKVLKIIDLQVHESQCCQADCKNFEACQNKVNKKHEKEQVCDLTCLLLSQLSNQDPKTQIQIARDFLQQHYASKGLGNIAPVPNPVPQIPGQAQQPGQVVQAGQQKFFWSQTSKGLGIEVSPDKSSVWLKETSYMFRTIVSDRPFTGGYNYWEISADPRTENELKIGISTKQEFNFNSAFCDFEYGYSFYGLGQLRHASNASGPQYGRRFKKEGVLGIFLNMVKGELSFSLNGEFLGIAFRSPSLKNGPIVAAASLLHCAGCKLETSKPVPNIFPK